MLPPERRDGLPVMCHEHATHAPVNYWRSEKQVVSLDSVYKKSNELNVIAHWSSWA